MSQTSTHNQKHSSSRMVQPRELVTFYRGCGFYSPAGRCWHMQVRGSVFASGRKRIHQHALLHILKRVVKPEKEQESRQRFLSRAQLFLQDTRSGKSVPISIAEKAYALPDSLPNGYFETTITLQESDLESSIHTDANGKRFIQFCAHLPQDDQRLFAGEIELIPPEGISVISDVDDTIKVTDVSNRKELLANTFTREFRSVDGMQSLYSRWAAAGTSIHYVSASPWQLYVPLTDWMDADGFPFGTVHLRHIRLRDLRGDRKKEDAYRSKYASIQNLLRMFPSRRFILCGDSGERDAELYGEIAKNFGTQIAHIAIRHCVTSLTDPDASLVSKRLAHLPHSQWTLFQDPEELDLEMLARS